MVRIQTLAYLSGFPSSFKATEQLRVKLPSVLTGKIKQVRAEAWERHPRWYLNTRLL